VSASPDLSVVVTVVEGADALRRCLEALRVQADAVHVETLVPLDETVRSLAAVVEKFEHARVVDVELPSGAGAFESEGERHELYDRRRTAGLETALGTIVALIEDRCVPDADWASRVVAAHAREQVGALGGAVESAATGLLQWAVYFCDYGRYQLPFTREVRDYVSDVNVSYTRQALDGTREAWRERYNEAVVHGVLRERNQDLVLDPEVVVAHGRLEMGLASGLVERFHWGRVFGGTRLPSASPATRLIRTALTPVLPLVVWARLLQQRLERRGRSLGVFVAATPAILLFLAAWSVGEAAAYVTGRSA